ncbi:MAG: hypothetical protein CMH41_07705, partial [Micrococcales bacterium]|nr:hypothetical protein [Micrococcales bacterium]
MYKNSPDRTHTITLHLLALAIGALLMGALMTVPTTARASVSYEPVTSLPGQLGSQSTGSQVELSFDGQTRAYAFRKLGQGGNPNRTRIVYSGDRGGTWQSHYVTEATVPSDGGVLGMSDDGQIMAVSYKRYPGVYAKFTFDGGANWSMEKTLSDGTSGRAWAPKVAVSGNGQTLVHSWFQKVSGKDTAHFTFSSDAGQTWSNPIQPSTPGATEHDVNVATSADGQTIALGWKSDNTTTQGYYTFDGGLNWIAKNISAEGTGTTGSSM